MPVGRMSLAHSVEQELLSKVINRLDEALSRLERLEDSLKRVLPPKPVSPKTPRETAPAATETAA